MLISGDFRGANATIKQQRASKPYKRFEPSGLVLVAGLVRSQRIGLF
jgi:hypothetical protein